VSKRRWYSGLLYQERSYLVSADVLANYTRSRGVGLQVHGNRVESVDVASHVVDIRVVRYGIWAAVGQGKKSIAGGVAQRGAEAAQRVCWRPVLEGVSKPGKIGEGTGAGLVESTNGE